MAGRSSTSVCDPTWTFNRLDLYPKLPTLGLDREGGVAMKRRKFIALVGRTAFVIFGRSPTARVRT
jgi:hypothetical protein